MLGQRSTLFGVILLSIFFFSAVTQSLHIGTHHRDVTELSSLVEKRAGKKKHNQPPCPPSKKKPKIKKVKDKGASVGILPYTAEMMKKAHEKENDKGKKKDKGKEKRMGKMALSSYNKLDTDALVKRVDDRMRRIYKDAQVQVQTDEGNGLRFDWSRYDIENQVIATDNLCGCTVVVIASPFVTFLVHVWERRAEENEAWHYEPEGDAQRQKDDEFIQAAQDMIGGLLGSLGGGPENEYNGFIPAESSSVHVIAPAANPDYDPNGNPVYTYFEDLNPQRLIYPSAANRLLDLATTMVVPGRGENARLHTYRRRYYSDDAHFNDDRQFITLKPTILDRIGEVWLQMLWDDDNGLPVVRLA